MVKTFAPFTSLCTTPRACKYSRPRSICRTYTRASGSAHTPNFVGFTSDANEPFSASSSTTYTYASCSTTREAR